MERELHTAFDPDGNPRYREVDVRSKWQELVEVSVKTLEQGSKDLHVAAWLTEALGRLDGFQGLVAGFDLVSGLVERYWDGLFPGPDPEPDEDGPFEDVNGFRIDQAVRAERGGSSADLDALRRAFSNFRSEDFLPLLQSIEASVASLERVDQSLLERVSADAEAPDALLERHVPISIKLREAIDDVLRNLRYLLQGVPQAATALAAAEAGAEAEEAVEEQAADVPDGHAVLQPAPPPVQVGGPPQSREDAMKYLRYAVEWFRANERHSPVSYACEQAVRWSDMPLPDLMNELIEDSGARGSFYKLTGIQPPESS